VQRLKEKYIKEIVPALKEELGLTNVMQVPRMEKIVINMGVGEATQNQRLIDEVITTISSITGQKPVATRAKKAISNFKIRENLPIGAKVTLHGDKMWDFLDRLITIALPRVRDFRGVPKRGFDGLGNYTMGIKEQIIFLEINYDKISQLLGMDVSFVTSAKDDDGCRALLVALGLPFRK
jgi:large subunit ribosomal protein L5